MRTLRADAKTYARWRWTGSGAGFEPVSQPGAVRVIDSWLVTDGRVRAFERHAGRFSSACAELFGIPMEPTSQFLLAAASLLPAEGRWFPRAELAVVNGTPRLQLWVRSAPPPGSVVRLWTCPEPDNRSCPRIKGADVDLLARLRQDAIRAGADEALLTSGSGRVLEGSTTSIMWWRGDTLCAPTPADGLLPGVTRSVLWDAVAASGASVAFEDPAPAELTGLEVWAVNALHGIRPVIGWAGSGIDAGPARRSPRWQRYLEEIAAPLSDDHAIPS